MEVREAIKILKTTASNKTIPMFAQYVQSDGGSLKTSNGYDYTELSCESNFVGAVNIFVLDAAIEKIASFDDVVIELNSIDAPVLVRGRNTGAVIQVVSDDMDFPIVAMPDVEYFDVTEDLMNLLRRAFLKGSIDSIYNYTYLGNERIVATDGSKINCVDIGYLEHTPIHPMLLSDKIISVLKPGYKMGVDDYKIIVDMPDNDGYSIFTTDQPSKYPCETMVSLISNSLSKTSYICNVAHILKGVEMASAVNIGEKQKHVNIIKSGDMLRVYAVSSVNGSSNNYIEWIYSEIKDFSLINISVDRFNKLSLDLDLYINPEDTSRMVFTSDDMTCLMVI